MLGKYSNIKEILFNNLLTIFLFILGLYFPFFIFLSTINLFFYWQNNLNNNFENYNLGYIRILFSVFLPAILIYFLLGINLFFLFMILIVILSLIIYYFFNKTNSFNKTFFVSSIYVIIFGIFFILWFKFAKNKQFFEYIYDNIKNYFTVNMYPYISPEIKINIEQNLNYFKDFFYSFLILFSLSSLALSFKIAEKYFIVMRNQNNKKIDKNIDIKFFFVNRNWRPNEYFIYLLLMNLFIILCLRTFPNLEINISGLLFLKNMLVLIFSVYVLEGFLLVHYFFKLLNVSRIFSIIFIFILLFFPYMIFSLGLFGVFDVFFNFRVTRLDNEKGGIKS